MTEEQKAREARAKADGILADYVTPGFHGIDDGNLYFAAMAYKESHDALAEKVRRYEKGLRKIRDKQTCEELNPGCEKYLNYEQGWDGVAEYAGKLLREAGEAAKKCPPHDWDRSGERCLRCGTKDWMT